MKKAFQKLCAVILAAGMLLPAGSILAEEAESSVSKHALGCFDSSDTIRLNDAKKILRLALRIDKTTDADILFSADYDGDGSVTLQDAKLVLRTALRIDKGKNSVEAVSGEACRQIKFISGYDKTKLDADGNEVSCVFKKEMTILTSKDQMEAYVSEAAVSTGHAAAVLEEYESVFKENQEKQQYNLLAVKLPVYSDKLEDIESDLYINGFNVLFQEKEYSIRKTEQQQVLYVFMLVDKKLNNEKAKLGLTENCALEGSVELIWAEFSGVLSGSGQQYKYDAPTTYIHLLRSSSEAETYLKFLETDAKLNLESEGNQNLISRLKSMDEKTLEESAYAALTYDLPSDSFSYELSDLYLEGGKLHITLHYIDESTPGVPGMRGGGHSVLVKVPRVFLDQLAGPQDVILQVEK